MPVEKRGLRGTELGSWVCTQPGGILKSMRAPPPPALYTGGTTRGASELLTGEARAAVHSWQCRQGSSSPPGLPWGIERSFPAGSLPSYTEGDPISGGSALPGLHLL